MDGAEDPDGLLAVLSILSLGPPSPDGSTILPLFVQPRASRSKWVGLHDGMLKVAIAAPPVDGAANKAVKAFVAKSCGVSKSAVSLIAGDTGRRKRVLVLGVSPDAVAERLLARMG